MLLILATHIASAWLAASPATTRSLTPVMLATPPPPPPQPLDVARAVDICLAAAGAGAAVWSLEALEPIVNLPLFAPPLAASSIIIFSGLQPAPAANVFLGTTGAAAFALTLYTLGGGSPEMRAIAVAGSLAWFKATGATFPPAAAMAAVFLDSPQMQELGWSYLLFPCLTGQLLLYAAGAGLAPLRQRVRVALTHMQLDGSSLGSSRESVEELRAAFARFDTSGDGLIDAAELQVALRAILQADVDPKDCEALVREADADGDGAICFDEFLIMLKYSDPTGCLGDHCPAGAEEPPCVGDECYAF